MTKKALVLAAIILMLTSIADSAPFAYITNYESNNVSVVDISANKVTATVNADRSLMESQPDRKKVCVANQGSGTVSVIDTAIDQVYIATVPIKLEPGARHPRWSESLCSGEVTVTMLQILSM